MKEDLANKLYQFREKAFSFINEAESVLNRIVLFSIIIAIVIWINLGRIIDLAVSENRIKSNLVRNLEEITGKKAEVAGEVSFESEPEATIMINNVKVHNNAGAPADEYLSAEVIKSHPSVFRAILGKVEFDNVYFENVKVNLTPESNGDTNVYDEIGKTFSKKSQFYGKKLVFKNLEVNIYKKNPVIEGKYVLRQYVFPDFELIPNPEKKSAKYEVKGSIKSAKLSEIYYFDFDIINGFGRESAYAGRVYSNDSELKSAGTLNTTDKIAFQGNISGKLTGFSKKVFAFLGSSEGFLDSVSDNDESNISGNLSYDGHTFEIKDLKGEGPVASFTLNSKTEYVDKISSIINISVPKLEYNKMFKTYAEMVSEKKAKKIERDFKKKLEEYFLFAINDDINFLFNFEAPDINFFHDQKGSLSISAIMKDNQFKIKNLKAKLPGDSDLTMIGEEIGRAHV